MTGSGDRESKVQETFGSSMNKLLNQVHDYNTSAEALSKALKLTIDHVAGELGLTGFQAGWAVMQFMAEFRNVQTGGIFLNFDDLIYPQYDLHRKLDEAIEGCKDRIAAHARENLQKDILIHPDVAAHMERVANGEL